MKLANFLMTLSLIAAFTFPVASKAAFLNELDGSYRIGGDKCLFESTTKPTGKARITSTVDSATVNIEVIIATLKTSIPFSFKAGNGDVKTARMEGDIIKLPVVRRTVWSTDEFLRKSTMTEYEGVAIPKKLSTTTLVERSSRELLLKIEDRDQIIECELYK
jgi:hypothetical protein